MNTLLLNRESFEMPADGWYQIAPVGEFPHGGAGVVQVVDRVACESMVAAFCTDAMKPNFAGLLIDFDHFSLDEKLKSEAAGWITALEARFRVDYRAGGAVSDCRLQTADCRRLQRRIHRKECRALGEDTVVGFGGGLCQGWAVPVYFAGLVAGGLSGSWGWSGAAGAVVECGAYE